MRKFIVFGDDFQQVVTANFVIFQDDLLKFTSQTDPEEPSITFICAAFNEWKYYVEMLDEDK